MALIGKPHRDYKRHDSAAREQFNNDHFLTGNPRPTSAAAREQRAIEAERDELIETVIDQVLSIIVSMLAADRCSLCQADEAQRQPPARSQPRPTAQSTIDAIIHCVRERGLDALEEPANIERLLRCDAAAKEQINRRIAAMKGVR
jgi:hypothetical protein